MAVRGVHSLHTAQAESGKSGLQVKQGQWEAVQAGRIEWHLRFSKIEEKTRLA